MKRTIFILGLVTMVMVCFAQETKKIAILEPVDRDGSVSYAHKLMLRANLAKAIANTPGYEAYDRADMDAIMSEQNFQRTGMVSDDQIKRLGEMTGAQFILVSEAVKVDESNMFITAKILNVESAKTEMTDNVLMGTSAANIQNGCINLAQKLLGIAPTVEGEITPVNTGSRKNTRNATVSPQTVTMVQNSSFKSSSGVGALYTFPDGSRGVVFYTDDQGHGLVVSLQESQGKWDSNRARDWQDLQEVENRCDASPYIERIGIGVEYTNGLIRQLGGMSPIVNWCRSLGDGWYVPCADELCYLLKVANGGQGKRGTISDALVQNGGTPIGNGWYWSSTECNRKEAMNISDGGFASTEDKDEENKIRAIRAY